MSSEQYCLRWNDHQTTLISYFDRLLQNGTALDCTLAAEGRCLPAHQVMLSACSPYFELMLNQHKEKHPIFVLKDIKFTELQAIIEYMYRGEVVIPQSQLPSLLQVAESLQIKGLGLGDKSQPPQSGTSNRGLIQSPKSSQPQQRVVQQPQQRVLSQPQKQVLSQQQKQVLSQPQKQVLPQPQLQVKQVVQKQVQPARFTPPTIRGLEVTQVIHDPAPQVVDLTDEPRAPPIVHPVQESAKRSMPQNTDRVKRFGYPVTPEKFNQNNVAALGTSLQNIYQQQNPIMANAAQGTTMVASTIPVASTLPKANPPAGRQTNESGGHNVPAPTILMTPAQRTETRDKRDSKPKPRMPAPQRRPNQGIVVQQITREQSDSPVATPPQNAIPAGAPKVSTPTTEASTAGRATKTDDFIEKTLTDKTASASPLSEVLETAESPSQEANDSEQKDALADPAANPTSEDPAAQESSLDNAVESPTKTTPALDKPGPSGLGKGKPGRRGRIPASERRFQCTECNKRFTQKSYLENHLRIHDGECYECDICNKTFLSRAALLKHLRAHAAKAPASGAPHKCQLCGAVSQTAAELEKHLTEHYLSGADDNN